MKGYWIVAAALSLAWPSTPSSCVGVAQVKSDETRVQQPGIATPSTAAQAPGQLQTQSNTQSENATAPRPAANTQNKDSYLLVELSRTLQAKKLKPGDKVKAEVSQDVISHGRVIIPVETELIGHVTEANARDEGHPESRLGIVFDKIRLKHFQDVSLRAVVQAVRPPVPRRSRVDEPSQMLPPALMMGNLRQPSPSAAGRPGGAGGRGTSSPNQQTAMTAETNSSTSYQTPMTVKESPTTHVQTGGSAAQLGPTTPTGQLLSVGTPQGVTGLKGLSLTHGATASTPGPVIVSNTSNVKLESGTQILLHVLSVETPKMTGKK